MAETMSNSSEHLTNQESLDRLREILKSLETSPAVKAAKMFLTVKDGSETMEGKIGTGVTFTQNTMDEILEHPDAKLYRSIKKILGLNEQKD